MVSSSAGCVVWAIFSSLKGFALLCLFLRFGLGKAGSF